MWFEQKKIEALASALKSGQKEGIEDFRFNAFTQGFKMPAKIGEAPDKLHSYQQMVQQGPNDALSMYFMPEVSEQPSGGVTYCSESNASLHLAIFDIIRSTDALQMKTRGFWL